MIHVYYTFSHVKVLTLVYIGAKVTEYTQSLKGKYRGQIWTGEYSVALSPLYHSTPAFLVPYPQIHLTMLIEYCHGQSRTET